MKEMKFKLICFVTILQLITSCRMYDYTTFEEFYKAWWSWVVA